MSRADALGMAPPTMGRPSTMTLERYNTTCSRHGGIAPSGYFECRGCFPMPPPMTPERQRFGCVGVGEEPAGLDAHGYPEPWYFLMSDECTADAIAGGK